MTVVDGDAVPVVVAVSLAELEPVPEGLAELLALCEDV